ncbi:MAG: hypothetical protein HY231_07740 [Acidobacteria bacterium]|nr:hypothetical protein [Acidobacteriota bacterium]
MNCRQPPALWKSATAKLPAPSRGFTTGYSTVRRRRKNEATGNFHTGWIVTFFYHLYVRHTKIRYERRDERNIHAVRQVSSPESWGAAHIERFSFEITEPPNPLSGGL